MTPQDRTPAPPMPADVAAAFAALPAGIRATLQQVRALIFRVADEIGAAPLTETLKWGEPAYLTEATRSGSTIRLGRVRDRDGAAVLFNCRTTLVAGFRDQFGDSFGFSGDRALILGPGALPEGPLAICIARALTYHRDPRKGRT